MAVVRCRGLVDFDLLFILSVAIFAKVPQTTCLFHSQKNKHSLHVGCMAKSALHLPSVFLFLVPLSFEKEKIFVDAEDSNRSNSSYKV